MKLALQWLLAYCQTGYFRFLWSCLLSIFKNQILLILGEITSQDHRKLITALVFCIIQYHSSLQIYANPSIKSGIWELILRIFIRGRSLRKMSIWQNLSNLQHLIGNYFCLIIQLPWSGISKFPKCSKEIYPSNTSVYFVGENMRSCKLKSTEWDFIICKQLLDLIIILFWRMFQLMQVTNEV